MSSFFARLKPGATAALLVTAAFSHSALAEDFISRIVGGVNSDISSAPATVALLDKARMDRDGDAFQSQFCGGTLINENWVVTAAHCVSDPLAGSLTNASEILVLDGTSNLQSIVRAPTPVAAIIVHPDYRSVENGADIALLQLSSPVLSPAAPIDNTDVVFNTPGLVAGWGALNDKVDGQPQSFTPQLQSTVVFMVPGQDCDQQFPQNQGRAGAPVTASQVCAGVAQGGRDSCQGDSGGPMYRIADSGELSLTGVISYGIGCALADFPGIYTRVQSYRDWINRTLETTPPPGVVPSTNLSSGGSSGGAGSQWLLLSLFCLLALRRWVPVTNRQ